MKLLIVDDEELTREGLTTSIDWKSIGIEQIFQADDGVNALQIVDNETPDILLCDVRMPRMTGIQLAEYVRTHSPDTSIIFMSGYSDKEYLKAAIKLNAVDYVEKPLNPVEVKETVLTAISQHQQKIHLRRSENLRSLEGNARMAILLTRPYKDIEDELHNIIEELELTILENSYYITYVVQANTSPERVRELQTSGDLHTFLELKHMRSYYAQNHGTYHIFHIESKKMVSDDTLSRIGVLLQQQFEDEKQYYICRGEMVHGLSKVYQSYSSAVLLSQNSFFFKPGCILFPVETENTNLSSELLNISPDSFEELLVSKDRDKTFAFADHLWNLFCENRSLLPTQVKDLYYKLFMSIQNAQTRLKINPASRPLKSGDNLMGYLENCFSYQELHQQLSDTISKFFQAIDSYEPEDSTIFMIKDYISKNYSNESLSIKEISDHVFLSTSYVCTYYKNQTGQTLNQYLTEFRMEKAKMLLADARYQITDISAKVGYSNGNYFSKSFKKFTGYTPSKYREIKLG